MRSRKLVSSVVLGLLLFCYALILIDDRKSVHNGNRWSPKETIKSAVDDWLHTIGLHKDVEVVEIVSFFHIGNYLWQHLLKGDVDRGATINVKRFENIEFRFMTNVSYLSENAKNVIITMTTSRLDQYKLKRMLKIGKYRFQNVGVMLFGNASCNNSFIVPHLQGHGGPIKFLLLIYDAPEIDNKVVYQWPLGVFTGRHFPVVKMSSIDIKSPRKFLANFVGSATNPSRNDFVETVRESKYGNFCYVQIRPKWNTSESSDRLNEHIFALRNSDLTFSPAGKNPECYRIYEAFSYGSVPVIEDIPCGSSSSPTKNETGNSLSPRSLRLLKEYAAPVIYVKNWENITSILEQEFNIPLAEKIRRRQKILFWYEDFKDKMKERFLRVVRKNFFGTNVFLTV